MEAKELNCEDCGGDGMIVNVRIEPRCCGYVDEYQGCCNNPIPEQVFEPTPCERCHALTGEELTFND